MPTLAGIGDVASRLTVGTYCGFNARTYFELDGQINIGDHVAVGQDVMFLTRTYDTTDPAQRAGKPSSAPIEIGNGSWLGARCTIMPGVKVGPGSVIGAQVVVDKDVPPEHARHGQAANFNREVALNDGSKVERTQRRSHRGETHWLAEVPEPLREDTSGIHPRLIALNFLTGYCPVIAQATAEPSCFR